MMAAWLLHAAFSFLPTATPQSTTIPGFIRNAPRIRRNRPATAKREASVRATELEAPHMTAYEKIAAELVSLIDKQVLRVGDRLPSVRRATRNHHVSPGTVLRAYRDLEARGVIESRPRSGYYVRRMELPRRRASASTSPPPVATPVIVGDVIVELVTAMSRPHLISLGLDILNPELLPGDNLNRTAARAARQLKPAGIIRSLTPGDPELRRLIALRYLDSGVGSAEDEIVIVNGGIEAVGLCLRALTKPGDTIAIESPNAWPQSGELAGMGLRVHEIPTDPRNGMDLNALEDAFRTRSVTACLVMPTFQNPLGFRMSDENKHLLAQLAARYEIPVIENDRVAELYFDEVRPRPVKAFDRSGYVLHCGSFATWLAPAYKIGWIAAGRYRKEVVRTKILLSLYTSPLCQAVMVRFLAQGHVERHLRLLRQTLAARCEVMIEAISRDFPAGCRMTHPAGGFVLWVELPTDVDSLELYRLALARGVSIAPGPMFSARLDYGNCLRLNFGYASVRDIRSGIRTIAQLIGRPSSRLV
jgi:DNA-binding transcriptional MocR family regulator